MKSFVLRNVDVTGKTPYYMKIEYRNKESEPCIRILRDSKSITLDDISLDSYSATELK